MNGGLQEVKLEISYSTDRHDMVRDFYVPCMKKSHLYRRAVGYFTSHGLAYAAKGIAHLIQNSGRIKLLASPILSAEDIAAIEKGHNARSEALKTIVERSFTDVENLLVRDRLGALSWLVESGALEVKLALRVDEYGKIRRGIFHEKMGIFTDTQGQSVAFSGSANETVGGLIENFEAIDVFCSWSDPDERVSLKINRFEKLWGNETNGLEVVDFTKVTADLLKQYQRTEILSFDPEEIQEETIRRENIPYLPDHIKLRDYQELAIRNWFKNNGRGTFKMATGTGKTITALGLIAKLYEKFNLQALIIVCPYRHLVAQWAEECRLFSLDPILAFENRKKWEERLSSQLYGASVGEDVTFTCVVTTNRTFSSEAFQRKISHFPPKTVIIADEVHNLGATNLRTKLPELIQLRLGLSATPERWFDDQGTKALFDYFGPILEPQITLKEALAKGVLCPYRYYPILVELTDEERVEYLDLSTKIAQMVASGKADDEDARLTSLLIRRSRLVASAQGKLPALREIMSNLKNETHMLFYCGDGTVEDSVTEEENRQIDAVTSLLGYDLSVRVAKYTAETTLDERLRLTQALDAGDIQGLVAIRCLDEGVDIPSIKTAIFMASSRNPRQFIQRRGRILRRSPGKEAAKIYDMIVVPPIEAIGIESERSLFKNELIRLTEFADLSLNCGQARKVVFELQKHFDLTDL